jgi:4-amino-4-deoxy-L-arabinose transferase-like glycosyltransferase
MNVAPLSPSSTEPAPAWSLSPAETRPALLHAIVLALLAILMTAPGIASIPPIDRDEARYVQATKQMVASGDYVDIRFQEDSRYKKPVGIYWLQSAVINAAGYGEDAPIWNYRLVSVAGIVLAVLATYWTGVQLFGRTAGLAAAVVMASIFAVAFEGRVAKTDAFLLGLCILAQGALARIYLAARRGEPQERHLFWLFWIAQGAGVLVKGPITPLLSLLTVATLVAYDRDWRWLARLSVLKGLGVVALIALPWLALITWKAGAAFWYESVVQDLFGKVGQGQESHGAPPGYYVVTYSLFFWPFGLLATSAWLVCFRHMRSDPRVAFCIAWYVPFWLLFEAIPTKLPHYVLPAYPALALVAGWMMTLGPAEAAQPLTRVQNWVRIATAGGHAVVTLGLAVAAVALPIYFGRGVDPAGLAAAVFVLGAGWLAFPRAELRIPFGRMAAAAASAAGAYALLLGVVFPSLSTIWLSPRIAEQVAVHRPCPQSVLAASEFHEPSLVFLAGTATRLTDVDGVARHLLADPACSLGLVTEAEEGRLAELVAAGGQRLQHLAQVDGVNYSRGDRLSLRLLRVGE